MSTTALSGARRAGGPSNGDGSSGDGPGGGRGSSGGRGSYGSGLGFGAFSFLSSAVLALAASVVVARLYGVRLVGEYALAGAPAGAVWLLSTVREQPALMRRLTPLAARDPLVTGLFASVFCFSFVLTAVVSLLVGLVSVLVLEGPLHQPQLVPPAEVMLLASLLFVNTCWNIDTVLGAFRAGRALFWCRFHQAAAYLALALLLGLWRPTIWGLVLAWYGSWATSLVQRLWSARAFMRLRVGRPPLMEGFSTLPEILRFGLRITPGFIAEGVSDEAGTWILAALVPLRGLGAYNRAWLTARRGLDLNYRITEMLFPTLIERRLAADRAGFDRALIDSLRYVAIGMLLPAAVAAGVAGPVMSIYGRGFGSAAGAFAYLAFLPGLVTLSAVQAHALFADDRGLLTSLYSLLRAAVTIVAAIALTDSFGVSGTGAGMLIGASAQLALISLRLPRRLAAPLTELWPGHELAGLLGAALTGFTVARALSLLLPHAAALTLGLPLGLAATAFVFVASGGLQARDRERARQLRRALGAGGRAPADTSQGSFDTP